MAESSIIVEDGGMSRPGANSYVSVADCDAWQAGRGFRDWPPPEPGSGGGTVASLGGNTGRESGDDQIEGGSEGAGDDPNRAVKEAALIRAADYLNGLRWKGRRAGPGRVMAWPRLGVVDGDGYEVPEGSVPVNVAQAQCCLAGLIYGGVDPQPVLERGGRIRSEKAGSLESAYFEDASGRDAFTALADLLSGLALGLGGGQGRDAGGGAFRVHRAVRG